VAGQWFSPASSTIKQTKQISNKSVVALKPPVYKCYANPTHGEVYLDIAEILLKVALNTIALP
jgi:PKD repeat protein